MPAAKKVKDKDKPAPSKKAKAEESSDDDDDDVVEEEEEMEGEHAKRKREKGRAAFFKLLRQLLALIPLAMLLGQQPFMVKPRAPGVNRGKVCSPWHPSQPTL